MQSKWLMNLRRWRFPFLTFFLLFSNWQRHCPSLYHWVLTVRGNAIIPTLQTRNGDSGKKMPFWAGECDFRMSLVHCFVHSLQTSVYFVCQSMLAAGNASDNGEYTSLRCCLVCVLIGLQCLNCTTPNSCLSSPCRHLHSALHTQWAPNKYLLHWVAWAYPQRPLRPLDCNSWQH